MYVAMDDLQLWELPKLHLDFTEKCCTFSKRPLPVSGYPLTLSSVDTKWTQHWLLVRVTGADVNVALRLHAKCCLLNRSSFDAEIFSLERVWWFGVRQKHCTFSQNCFFHSFFGDLCCCFCTKSFCSVDVFHVLVRVPLEVLFHKNGSRNLNSCTGFGNWKVARLTLLLELCSKKQLRWGSCQQTNGTSSWVW